MSTVQCLGCASLNLKDFKQHSAQGFGRCPHDATGIFVNIATERECKDFKPGDADIVATRIEWKKTL